MIDRLTWSKLSFTADLYHCARTLSLILSSKMVMTASSLPSIGSYPGSSPPDPVAILIATSSGISSSCQDGLLYEWALTPACTAGSGCSFGDTVGMDGFPGLSMTVTQSVIYARIGEVCLIGIQLIPRLDRYQISIVIAFMASQQESVLIALCGGVFSSSTLYL